MISKTNFRKMVKLQRELDAKIYKAQGIEAPPLERIDASYRVEVGEAVNNLKGNFKYWSLKSPERQKFIEEFIDAIHFMLSYAYHYADYRHEYFDYEEGEDRIDYMYRELSSSWVRVNRQPVAYSNNPTALIDGENMEDWQVSHQAMMTKDLIDSFNYLTIIAKRLNFTEEDVQEQYRIKNAINHDRSDSGVY